MNLFESTIQTVKRTLRLTSSSTLVGAIRPAYDLLLNTFYGRGGLERLLNGEERVWVRAAHRYAHEDYEPALYNCLKRLVKPGAVVLDIGAHVGLFTIVLARWVGSTGRVFAFEPTPATGAALADHLTLNGVAEQVEVVGQAISDAVGEATFYVVSISPENTLNSVHSRLGAAHEVRVPMTTIDAFCSIRALAPTLLKIDIEGFELHALRGAKNTLLCHRPVVVVELHPMNWPEIGESPATATALVAELGFQAIPLEGQTNPFAEYGHIVLEPIL